MLRFSRRRSLAVAVVAIVAIAVPMTVLAHGGGNNRRLSAEPWIYVGKANDCGTPYPAGSRIVTSAWLGGMGLPDNGTSSNTLNPIVATGPAAASRNDPHLGLLLNKNGPTGDCSAAGATINGVKGMVVDPDFALGYDYRNGGHCGAGAPRFNVTVKPPASSTPETFHFSGGCSNDSTPTPAPQDPEWTRVRFDNSLAEMFPPIPPNSRIVSIELILDEGTDTPTVSSPMGVGLTVVDNIYIDGILITRGSGIEPGSGGRSDKDHRKGDDDD